MIYELRTTRVRPGGVPEFERRLEASVGARQQHSRLAGCWHTEIGPLLQVVELWLYEDRQHQAEVSEAVAKKGGYPALDGDLVRSVEIELLEPAPFMRALDGSPRQDGPYYELRTYQIRSGQVGEFIERWAPMVPAREALSPLLGAWHSEAGRWFHLWPYRDLAERSRIREEAIRQGIWPPQGHHLMLSQENKILLPASFSPLQ